VQPGGRFTWTGTTLRPLIALAHRREAFDNREVLDGPAWLDRDHFDIVAKAPESTPLVGTDGQPGPVFAMLRQLLEERFGLRLHDEVRERPAYALVMARTDRRTGPRLVPVTGDCTEAIKAMAEGRARGLACTFGGGPGLLRGTSITLAMLARELEHLLQRPVADRTGLAGSFDVDLSFAPEFMPSRTVGPGPQGPAAAPADAPSIFAALQEQLGLRLETTRARVDVLVVDAAHLPEPD
jgi:uncharacterized protein (TIGR03435 family)